MNTPKESHNFFPKTIETETKVKAEETNKREAFETDFDTPTYVKPAYCFEPNNEFVKLQNRFDTIKTDKDLIRLWFDVAQNQANYVMFLVGVAGTKPDWNKLCDIVDENDAWIDEVYGTMDSSLIVDQCIYSFLSMVPSDFVEHHATYESWRNERNMIRNSNKDQKFMARKIAMMERCMASLNDRPHYCDHEFNEDIKKDKYELCLDVMILTKWSYVFASSLVDECILKVTKSVL